MGAVTTPTKEQIRILTDKHLARYRAMRDRAVDMKRRLGHCDGYRLDEIAELLEVWESVEKASWNWLALDARARAEVHDAMEDEGWLYEMP